MHTSNTINSIDPRLLDSMLSASTSALPTPSLYKKSKKQVKAEISDDEEGGGPVQKKVDLGYAITSLSVEMAKGRKLQKDHKSN